MSAKTPDWAALYQKHRDSMYRVAARVLREADLEHHASDAVQDAITSLMQSPPVNIRSWEAVLVTAAKRKALDLLRSARVRHAGPAFGDRHDFADEQNDIAETEDALDRQRFSKRAWAALDVLDERHRTVVQEYVARERSRADVASDLGVSPARVSQMAAKALERLRREITEGSGK